MENLKIKERTPVLIPPPFRYPRSRRQQRREPLIGLLYQLAVYVELMGPNLILLYVTLALAELASTSAGTPLFIDIH